MRWMPLAPPGTAFGALADCRSLAVSGEAVAGIATELCESLAAHGLILEPGNPDEADFIVLMHGLGPDPLLPAFLDLTRLAERSAPPRAIVGVALDTADGAGFGGLVRTAAVEWGSAWKCITVAAGADPVAVLGGELSRGGEWREVRIGATREVRTRVPAPPGAGIRVVPAGVWVISGGARGVTAACALALARAGATRLVLLGRTALADEPPECRGAADEVAVRRVLTHLSGAGTRDLAGIGRQARDILAQREIRSTLAAIAAAGAEARYVSVDVADAMGVRAALDAVRKMWGPVRGLVHAAGVLADKRLGEKTADQFSHVVRAKLAGATALLDACADDPLEQICFFSSVAAHAGNAGQSDYAAANAALDRRAVDERVRRGGAAHVVSIAWGPWHGGMVTDALARHFTARGIGLIPIDAGAQAFVAELRHGVEPSVIIGSGLDDERVVSMRVRVRLADAPMLHDHRINDTVVLPMAFAMDVMIGAARAALGSDCELHDVRLLQGVVFTADAVDLELRAEPLGPDRQLVTLLHASGRPAYRAEAVARPHGADCAAPSADRLDGISTGAALGVAPLATPYAEALFHGPAFRVIREVLACSETTICGRVATASSMGWPDGWQIDPAALDGALQLLRLWGITQTGRPSLPTAIASCRPMSTWPTDGEVECIVTCRAGTHSVTGDARLVSPADRRVLLALDGLVMHMHR